MATESFTAANGTKLSALTGWVKNNTSASEPEVLSNALVTVTADDQLQHNTETVPNDQWAEIAVSGFVGGDVSIGPAVRVHATAFTGYILYVNPDTRVIFKIVGGSFENLAEITQSTSGPHTIRLGMVGTTLTSYMDGSTTNMPSYNDSEEPLTNGYSGILCYGNNNTVNGDNWQSIGSGDLTINKSEGVTLGESRTVALSDALAASKSEGLRSEEH